MPVFTPSHQRKDRAVLGAKIRQSASRLSEQLTASFFDLHPDWLPRYGAPGWQRAVGQGELLIEHLAAAIELAKPLMFRDHAEWLAGLFSARHMPSAYVGDVIRQLQATLQGWLTAQELEPCARLLEATNDFLAGRGNGLRIAPEAVPLAGEAREFLTHVLENEEGLAFAFARDFLMGGHTPPDLYEKLFAPALYEVGDQWERNLLNVAQEHAASEMIGQVAAQCRTLWRPQQPGQGRFLMTGVPGEGHNLGARFAADLFTWAGWKVFYIGSDLPERDVIRAAERFRPHAVGISACMAIHIPQARSLVSSLRTYYQTTAPKILIGGAAFRYLDSAAEIGADYRARNVLEAIGWLRRIVPVQQAGIL